MGKPSEIELPGGERIGILYEDRSAMAIDKPPGWILAPDSWKHTDRNLQAALVESLRTGAFWARARQLRYLRFVHRLDADTSGVLLLARSPGALRALSRLFENRQAQKVYLAVVRGKPRADKWTCGLAIAPEPGQPGVMRTVGRGGKPAETRFCVLETGSRGSLVEARPVTGRTHQVRLHLAASGCPVLGDNLYGPASRGEHPGLALRAVRLAYRDPFTGRPVQIQAPAEAFLHEHGFGAQAPPTKEPAGRPAAT